ncbi:MAG: type II toxin-antitoxin system prevent-host-death family antitoxin [Alphaproteobacteria bacterium]|nr:type II toxin-antitoxin system prevent-host-death family antitoxin [Alphaproteobacteria bacterium]
MKPAIIRAAKANLSKLIKMACAGETIVIARSSKPVARLVPIEAPKPRRCFGAMKGSAKLDGSFFDPLPPDELALWE